MRNLIAFPILALAVILQSAVVSRVGLLGGFADLPLVLVIAWALQENVNTGWHWAIVAGLMTAFVSGLAWIVVMLGFIAAVLVARVLQSRIWQAPLLAMLGVTFFATLIVHLLSFVILSLTRAPLPFADTFSLITLPSVLLNMLLAIPMFWFMRDLSRWVFPIEEDE
jgi:cell shape-determining protein MreD